MQCACTILSSVTCPDVQNFSACSKKGHNFLKKKVLNVKHALIFSTTSDRNTFYSRKNWARYDKKNAYLSSCKVPSLLSDFNGTSFLRKKYKKHSNNKFRENPSSGSLVVPFGRMEGRVDAKNRHDQSNCRFSQFCERLKNMTFFIVPNQTEQDWRSKRFERVRNRFSE
jgi:hypothetical protein